ncbi:putative dual specificity phosphatase, catalytic domain [Lyophyllum shimeji]|uniref:Dual specificity phosphatase, catalytic domain n=1 Tax=Lyophyllum shimeji TaxID=47721 RepID=A0A9P3PJX8_LYOSH|nr:putative dual specificity phosphatase, catalytic domain [Lyophyllum shimeji]
MSSPISIPSCSSSCSSSSSISKFAPPPPPTSSSSSSSPSPSPPSAQTQTQTPPPTKAMLATAQRRLNALSPRPLSALRPRPIPNSYWATPHLLACEYPWTPKNPHKPKLDALLRAGVRTFIDLTEAGELIAYRGVLTARAALLGIDVALIEYHRFPIRDRALPHSLEHMYGVLDVLRDNERRGRVGAVHCRGGIGRTGMVIGCWLVEAGYARDGEEALGIIAREWRTVEKCTRYPHSPETGSQFEYVLNFHPKGRSGLSNALCI